MPRVTQHPDVGLAVRAVAEPGGAHRLAEARVDLARRSAGRQREHAGRLAQPPHVAVEEERLAVVGPQRFVDAFAVEKPVIEDRDDRVLLVGHAAVDVDRGCHRTKRTACAILGATACRCACHRDDERPASSMRVLNAAQMREADRRTIDDIGIPSLVLMENAGRQVVAAMEAMHSDLLERQVAVLCGRGNNGGDGFVVARTLVQRGVDVSVFLIGRVADVRGDARINLEILGRLGLTVVEIADSQAWELHFSEVSDCTLIVDAIFGTGLNAPVSGLIEIGRSPTSTRRAFRSSSIDLPSGLSADSPEPIGDRSRRA